MISTHGNSVGCSFPMAVHGHTVYPEEDRENRWQWLPYTHPPRSRPSVRISIHLSPEAPQRAGSKGAASAGSRAKASPLPAALNAIAKKHGLDMLPLFPGTESLTWQTEAPAKDAEGIVDELLKTPGIDGAYIKPAESPPRAPGGPL